MRAGSGSAKFATRLLRHARLERWFNCPAQVWAMENTSAFFIRSTTSVDLGVGVLRVAFFECVYFGKRAGENQVVSCNSLLVKLIEFASWCEALKASQTRQGQVRCSFRLRLLRTTPNMNQVEGSAPLLRAERLRPDTSLLLGCHNVISFVIGVFTCF